jgi:DNA-binding response OmpR family regulator
MGEERVLKILLVEDHADTALLLARLLQRAKHAVKTALDLASAEEMAGKEPFDLVISDLRLPDGSGLDLMRSLKERYQLRGIAMTGCGMDEDIRLSKEAGFVEHLTKPIDIQQLMEKIAGLAAQ